MSACRAGNPGGVPPAAGYNPSLSHLTWLRTVYPHLPAEARPLECMQEAGDIVYVLQKTGFLSNECEMGDNNYADCC